MSTALTNANGFDIHKKNGELCFFVYITMRFGVIILCLQSLTVIDKPTRCSILSVSEGLGYVFSQI